MKILVYSFRTFPLLKELEFEFGDIFIFSSLKKDLAAFEEKVIKTNPDIIIGFAKAQKDTRLESFAVNKFNKNGQVEKGGAEKIPLFAPEIGVKVVQGSTRSFCNWTMYKIASLLKGNKLTTKIMFIHVSAADFPNVVKTVKSKLELQK